MVVASVIVVKWLQWMMNSKLYCCMLYTLGRASPASTTSSSTSPLKKSRRLPDSFMIPPLYDPRRKNVSGTRSLPIEYSGLVCPLGTDMNMANRGIASGRVFCYFLNLRLHGNLEKLQHGNLTVLETLSNRAPIPHGNCTSATKEDDIRSTLRFLLAPSKDDADNAWVGSRGCKTCVGVSGIVRL